VTATAHQTSRSVERSPQLRCQRHKAQKTHHTKAMTTSLSTQHMVLAASALATRTKSTSFGVGGMCRRNSLHPPTLRISLQETISDVVAKVVMSTQVSRHSSTATWRLQINVPPEVRQVHFQDQDSAPSISTARIFFLVLLSVIGIMSLFAATWKFAQARQGLATLKETKFVFLLSTHGIAVCAAIGAIILRRPPMEALLLFTAIMIGGAGVRREIECVL
jgi:hypothetical protein